MTIKRLPTTDLYFLNACHGALGGWLRRGPMRRLGENCFSTGDTVLLLRRDGEGLMEALCRDSSRRLIYLIDDDVDGARASTALPAGYRARLHSFHERFHRRLTERADTLVVTSEALARKFPQHRDLRTLNPVWHLPPADDRHYQAAAASRLEIVHLGSGSHSDAHQFLRRTLHALLTLDRNVRFTYFGSTRAFGALEDDPRVRRIAPKPWRSYRRWIGRQRFHLALYPLPESAFNKARSINKLIEHGIVGAAAIYSDGWEGARLMDGGALTATADPDAWAKCVIDNLDTERLRAVYNAARPVTRRLNDPAAQRRFWSDLLATDVQ